MNFFVNFVLFLFSPAAPPLKFTEGRFCAFPDLNFNLCSVHRKLFPLLPSVRSSFGRLWRSPRPINFKRFDLISGRSVCSLNQRQPSGDFSFGDGENWPEIEQHFSYWLQVSFFCSFFITFSLWAFDTTDTCHTVPKFKRQMCFPPVCDFLRQVDSFLLAGRFSRFYIAPPLPALTPAHAGREKRVRWAFPACKVLLPVELLRCKLM